MPTPGPWAPPDTSRRTHAPKNQRKMRLAASALGWRGVTASVVIAHGQTGGLQGCSSSRTIRAEVSSPDSCVTRHDDASTITLSQQNWTDGDLIGPGVRLFRVWHVSARSQRALEGTCVWPPPWAAQPTAQPTAERSGSKTKDRGQTEVLESERYSYRDMCLGSHASRGLGWARTEGRRCSVSCLPTWTEWWWMWWKPAWTETQLDRTTRFDCLDCRI